MNATTDDLSQPRMIDLPSRGGAMAALEFGPRDRPVDVIFSHANGFNGRTYHSILAPLGDTLRILAIDLRGHGATTIPPGSKDARGGRNSATTCWPWSRLSPTVQWCWPAIPWAGRRACWPRRPNPGG